MSEKNFEARRGTTGIGRLAFVQLWEPKQYKGQGEAFYSCTLLVPKTDTVTKAAIDKAMISTWVDTYGKTQESAIAFEAFKKDKNFPVMDGDDPKYAKTEGFAGHWGFRFKAKDSIKKPQIVDEQVNPLLDRSKLYSGVKALVVFYAYAYGKNWGKGVSLQVDIVQRVGDAPPFGAGQVDAKNVLKPVAGSGFSTDNSFPSFGGQALRTGGPGIPGFGEDPDADPFDLG